MNTITFLDRLSEQIKLDFPTTMDQLVVVLPNKRAKIFLLENLKKYYSKSVFAPEIISIEELIQEISGIRAIDNIELMFEFYLVYKQIEKGKAEDFDHFGNWAQTLLQDFNEVDRYLLKPDYVFSYLKNIEDLKHWALDPDQRTEFIAKYLEFWDKMPVYYDELYKTLVQKKIGYQGLIYREAVVKHDDYLNKSDSYYYFAGFNALNAAEEVIIQHVLLQKRGKVFWDMDKVFLQDTSHDAGLFLRRIKKNWKYYQSHPFNWIVDEFSKEKNIDVIQTPKSVGQAKIAGQIVQTLIEKGASLDKVAVVLGDENLLLPVLHGLPKDVKSLNITMGYSGSSNPVQILLNKIFKLHVSALKRSETSYVVYYKEILDVLSNPLLTILLQAEPIVKEIHARNLTFFNIDRFQQWIKQEDFKIRDLVFSSWRDKDSLQVLETLVEIVLAIRNTLDQQDDNQRLIKTFLYSAYQMLTRLISYCQSYAVVNNIETLFALYKQVMDMAEVSFEGEPLEGLQIMGVLESRVLDFETVIITSVNEGKFPAGKSQNSFIPYDVKREIGLPTFKEKDAIYSYHFYHLLQRAKNVYLLYNSQNDGMDSGEKSRFLTQLEVEKQANHQINYLTYSAELPDKAYRLIDIPKSQLLLEELESISTGKGFSPSALSNYLRNPIQFYMQRVLRIKELDEVEESVALNTLGTIIHNTLEKLYKPYKGHILNVSIIQEIQRKANLVLENEFESIYNSDKEKMGKNLLAFEVAKRNVYHFLNQELDSLKKGDEIILLELETELKHTVVDKRLPYPVNIFGFVDRIERRNGVIRVIDYKTGKVTSGEVKLAQWEGLTADLKNDKIIQLLCYGLMYQNKLKQPESVEAGIYSFKNRKEGFLFFGLQKSPKEIDTRIDEQKLELFQEELVQLLMTILNPDQSFIESL
ncbi:PD-(D/E)XK nuclease family protein [Myroides sp. LJL119]